MNLDEIAVHKRTKDNALARLMEIERIRVSLELEKFELEQKVKYIDSLGFPV